MLRWIKFCLILAFQGKFTSGPVPIGVDLNLSGIYRHPNITECLNDLLSSIIERIIPSKILKFRVNDKPWFNAECKLAYHEKHEAYHLWRSNHSEFLWQNFTEFRSQAQNVYEWADRAYNEGVEEIMLSSSDNYKWWSTLKSSLFGMDPIMPPFLKPDGAASYCPNGKTELLAEVLESKQRGESLLLPQSCFLSLSCVQWPSDLEKLKLFSWSLTFMVALTTMGYCLFFYKRLRILLLLRLLQFSASWLDLQVFDLFGGQEILLHNLKDFHPHLPQNIGQFQLATFCKRFWEATL